MIKKLVKYICLDYNLIKNKNLDKSIAIKKVIKYINNNTVLYDNFPIKINNMNNYKIIKIIKGFRKLSNLYKFNKRKKYYGKLQNIIL